MKSILPEQLKKNINGIVEAVRETVGAGDMAAMASARTDSYDQIDRSMVVNIKTQIKQKMV